MTFLDTHTDILQKTDEEILARSMQSPSLFSIIVDRYEDVFLRRAEHVMKRREDAEDVVQEAFTKIYMNASRFEPVAGASFKSWAFKILFNTAFSAYRKKKKEDGVVVVEQDLYESFPDMRMTDIEDMETCDYVASLISRLPQTLARVLTLHFLEEKSQQEIAQEEGTTVSAIKARVHRAKKELREIDNSVL